VNQIFGAVGLAIRAILRNKTRAALTILGILIGVAAVVAVTGLAGGATARVGGEIDGFATEALYVNPQTTAHSGARGKTPGRLTENDAKAIARDSVSVVATTVFSQTSGQVIYGDRNAQTILIGTTLPYMDIRKWKMEHGEVWTDIDELLKSKVCVLGATVAEKLFQGRDPVGETLRIARYPYKVIGVFRAQLSRAHRPERARPRGSNHGSCGVGEGHASRQGTDHRNSAPAPRHPSGYGPRLHDWLPGRVSGDAGKDHDGPLSSSPERCRRESSGRWRRSDEHHARERRRANP